VAEEKNGFRRHVSAAKEWLDETEASLDKKEDIKGDLSFMLAQAELARAKEVKQPKGLQKILPQLAALLAACLLAGGWLLWQRTEDSNPSKGSDTAIRQEAVKEIPQEQATVTPAGKEQKELPPQPAEPVELEQEEKQPAAADFTEQRSNMPDESLQRLMSEAGKTLRAQ